MRFLASILPAAVLCAGALAHSAPNADASSAEFLAIKAPKVYVGNGDVLEHAVLLVQDGKIITVGEDLPIEAGIPVLELDDDQVVMPGLINAYSRMGSSANGSNSTNPHIKAAQGFYPSSRIAEYMEAGITTLGYYPPGRGIPGQAAVMRTVPDANGTHVYKDSAYVKFVLRSSRTEKDRVRSIYTEIEKHEAKEKKNREKYDKAKEKAEKEKDKKKKKEKLDKLGDYKPLTPNPKVQAMMDIESKKLHALLSLDRAGTYLHFLDALDDKPMEWSLRIPINTESDFGNIAHKVGEQGLRVIMDPVISNNAGTLQRRNLPAEFASAGAKLVLIPNSDAWSQAKNWRKQVAMMIRSGLDEAVAMRAITLEPAHMLGIAETHGSLEVGKQADLLILSGEPFEASSDIDAVMMNGKIVHGEVGL